MNAAPLYLLAVLVTILLSNTSGYRIFSTAFSRTSSSSSSSLLALKFDPSYFVDVSVMKPLGLSLEENEPNSASGVYISSVGSGNAQASGKLTKGLYLIQVGDLDVKYADFDSVIDAISAAPADKPLKLVFIDPKTVFKGPATIKVRSPGGEIISVGTLKGQRLRTVLQDNKIEVHPSNARFTNCGGAGQCRTCVVKITNNKDWIPRPQFEDLALKRFDGSARLSCNTIIEGDCDVEVQPAKSS